MSEPAAAKCPATRRMASLADSAFLVLLLVAVLWPLANLDWFDSHEGVRYLLRLDALQQNLGSQGGHPRWVPECAGGRGMPYFTYYAPGFPYLCLLFAWLGATGAVKAAITLVTFVGAWSALQLGSEWGGRHGGRLAALLVVASPYPMFNLYLRGDLAEYSANHLAVPVLWLVWRLAKGSGGKLTALAAGLLHGLLITQHNVMALLFTGAILVFGVGVGVVEKSGRKQWLGMAVVPLLGVAVSAWFWLPALAQLSLVDTATLVSGGYEVERNLFKDQQWAWRLSRSTPVLGPILVAAVIALAALSAKAWLPRGRGLFLASGVCLLLVLMQPVSVWVWHHVPLMHYVQFPWRLLGISTVMSALAAAHFGALPAGWWPRPRLRRHAPTVVLAMSALALAYSFQNIVPSQDSPQSRQMTYWTSARFTHNRYSEPMTSGEFAPITADPQNWPAFGQRAAMSHQPGGPLVVQSGRNGALLTVRLNGGAGELLLAQFWHPTWLATVDGAEVECSAGPGGCILVPVAAGVREVRVTPVRTTLEKASEWVSALAFLATMVALAALTIRRYRAAGTDP